MRPVVAKRHPRTKARSSNATSLNKPDDALPVWSVRLEQSKHPRVVRARAAGEYETDDVRQVVVADRHDIGGAVTALHHLGSGPRTDARQRSSGAAMAVSTARDAASSSRASNRRCDEQRAPPRAVEADAMPVPVGDRAHHRSRRHHSHAFGCRTRRGVTEPAQQRSPAAPRLDAGHQLFEDRRHECLKDTAAR